MQSVQYSPKKANPNTVGGKVCIGELLASGGFAVIHRAVDVELGIAVAVKVQPSSKKNRAMLEHEANILTKLRGVAGFPCLHSMVEERGHLYLVMDLLGPSVLQLWDQCKRRLSLMSFVCLAIQMSRRIAYLHSRGILHRDVKPDNFVVGRGSERNVVYAVDFGLSKSYVKADAHIPYRENLRFVGTARYASIRAHKCTELSRRDDMESFGYTLLYLYMGSLPWQGIRADSHKEKINVVMKLKAAMPIEELCKGAPPAFVSYFDYCRLLRFTDRPDYRWLIRHFRAMLANAEVDFGGSELFDWSAIQERQRSRCDSRETATTAAAVGSVTNTGSVSPCTCPGTPKTEFKGARVMSL